MEIFFRASEKLLPAMSGSHDLPTRPPEIGRFQKGIGNSSFDSFAVIVAFFDSLPDPQEALCVTAGQPPGFL